MSNLIEVVITEKKRLNDDILSLTLENKEGTALPAFSAGAHIDVHINDDIVRQYSLCSAPNESRFYRLGILKEPESRGGSIGIHETFHVGDVISISEPRNLFPLDLSAEHSILVGGGIGITPMISMAYTLKSANKSFELHYCAKSKMSAVFAEELENEFGSSLKLHCDDLEDTQRLDPQSHFSNAPKGTHLYTCGPSGFMNWVMDSAKALGFPDSNIHCEYFNVDVDTAGTAFTVIAEQSGKTIEVSENQSIVQALAEAGIKVEVSCEQGICGTCIVDVIEGEPDHRDQFLTDDEKADNDQIAVCCSRSKSSILILDI